MYANTIQQGIPIWIFVLASFDVRIYSPAAIFNLTYQTTQKYFSRTPCEQTSPHSAPCYYFDSATWCCAASGRMVCTYVCSCGLTSLPVIISYYVVLCLFGREVSSHSLSPEQTKADNLSSAKYNDENEFTSLSLSLEHTHTATHIQAVIESVRF